MRSLFVLPMSFIIVCQIFSDPYPFLLDFPINILASIGLFGKGPEMLPSSIIYDISPSDWRETELQVTFELNENGSIMRERYDDNRVTGRYIYEYIPLSEMTTSK